MLGEVEVGAGVDAFHFLESERHLEFDVGGCVGVVGQLVVVVIAIFLVAHAESLVPLQAPLFPVFKPFEFLARTHEELHLHLLELAHAEDELACHDLVAERFAYLGYAEGEAHTAGLLHVEVVDKYALCGLGAEIYCHGAVGRRSHLGAEHEVELAYFRPVLGA